MIIAHISDFHLRQHLKGTSAALGRLSREMVDKVPRALEQIVEAHPDLVVVSGDLIDHPFEDMDHPDHLDAGRRDLRWFSEALSVLPMPTVVLPGNHDHLVLFHEQFQIPVDFIVKGLRILSFADAEGENHIPQRQGDERVLFDQALADQDPRPQVHLQHYLVYPRRDEGYPHTYGDAEALRTAIARSGRVRLCLSGHYHPGHEPECVDGTWFSVAPAFCEAPHRWRLYRLDVDGCTLTWEPRQLGQA